MLTQSESVSKVEFFVILSYVLLVTFLSVMRQSIFIYLEALFVLIAVLVTVLSPRKYGFVCLCIISVTIFGNFVAPMDNELRFESNYPSLHTLSIFGGLKVIDLALFILSFSFIIKFILGNLAVGINKYFISLIFLVVFSSVVVFFKQNEYVFDFGFMLFIIRGLLLFFVFYIIASDLKKFQIIFLLKTAISTCICLMIFAHLFHAENPMVRTLLGFNVTVAFAGDEYGSIGILIAAILVLDKNQRRYCFYIALICFLLAIFAGRKSAIPYFFFVGLMIFFNSENNIGKLKKSLILSEHIYITIALLCIKALDFLPLNLAFHESLGILNPTIDSLNRMFRDDFLTFIIGIGPFFKYPLYGLDIVFDHPFAFGGDAGELYKIKLWFFPFDRAILNFGFIIPVLFTIKMIFFSKNTSSVFYIILYSTYLLFFNAVSIIMCVSLAFAHAAIKIKKQKDSDFNTY